MQLWNDLDARGSWWHLYLDARLKGWSYVSTGYLNLCHWHAARRWRETGDRLDWLFLVRVCRMLERVEHQEPFSPDYST